MPLDESLRRGGFRRWYERQLIESHAWLVTAFLALIMMAVALETVEFGASLANALALTLVALSGGGLMLYAWQRFTALLTRAESLAVQAVCSECRAYGRFDVLQARDSAESLSGRSLRVRCRNCAHEWTMG
ncbi:MAG TPA: hypothetical protein VFX05_17850 [Casimicrobiaceae bacterium]|nr:hypothetical protein [Casimicrobiaceae bacterium]